MWTLPELSAANEKPLEASEGRLSVVQDPEAFVTLIEPDMVRRELGELTC